MTNQFNSKMAAMALINALAIFAGDATASAAFTSQATVGFSVENIVSSSSDVSNLKMSGSFMRSGADFPVTWTNITGDASVTDVNPELEPVLSDVFVGDIYQHTFALNGHVSDGVIDFNQVGWYQLGFVNQGSASFDITLNFSYQLFTEVTGQVGSTSILIGYQDENGFYQGVDVIEATTQSAELLNSVVENVSSSGGPFTFTLNSATPNMNFYVNINHVGYLEASPVPLPTAAWAFLTGLVGVVGLGKRRFFATQMA
jgi:hypothetical protein